MLILAIILTVFPVLISEPGVLYRLLKTDALRRILYQHLLNQTISVQGEEPR